MCPPPPVAMQCTRWCAWAGRRGGGAWPHFQATALLTRGPRGSHLLPPTLVTEVEPRQPGSLTNRQRPCPRPNFNGAPLSPLLAPEAPILASPIHVWPSQFQQESCKASFQGPWPLVIQPHLFFPSLCVSPRPGPGEEPPLLLPRLARSIRDPLRLLLGWGPRSPAAFRVEFNLSHLLYSLNKVFLSVLTRVGGIFLQRGQWCPARQAAGSRKAVLGSAPGARPAAATACHGLSHGLRGALGAQGSVWRLADTQ